MKDMKKMKGREFCNLSNKVIGCAIEVHKTLGSGLLESTYQQCLAHELRSVDLIIPESMAQDFGFTVVLGKQAHSRLRNCFSSAAVESKGKSGSGIIELPFLTAAFRFNIIQPLSCRFFSFRVTLCIIKCFLCRL